jgi:hypothetical protein
MWAGPANLHRGFWLPPSTMSERLLFPALVIAGFLGLGAIGWARYRAPDRLRAEAAAAGFASVDLAIREMG